MSRVAGHAEEKARLLYPGGPLCPGLHAPCTMASLCKLQRASTSPRPFSSRPRPAARAARKLQVSQWPDCVALFVPGIYNPLQVLYQVSYLPPTQNGPYHHHCHERCPARDQRRQACRQRHERRRRKAEREKTLPGRVSAHPRRARRPHQVPAHARRRSRLFRKGPSSHYACARMLTHRRRISTTTFRTAS